MRCSTVAYQQASAVTEPPAAILSSQHEGEGLTVKSMEMIRPFQKYNINITEFNIQVSVGQLLVASLEKRSWHRHNNTTVTSRCEREFTTWCSQTLDSSLLRQGNRTEEWLWASVQPLSSAWWASLAVRGEKFTFRPSGQHYTTNRTRSALAGIVSASRRG